MKRFFTKKTATILSILTLALFILPLTTNAAWYDFLLPQTYINKLFQLVILPLAGGALAVVGSVLDLAVKFSLGTAYVYGNIQVINESWAIIRDICNLFFIFALIWISISIILSLSSFNAKRHLTQLIIAALIINFSLYFTKVIVDVSNIFGNWLYSGILNIAAVNKATSISALIAMKFEIFRLWQNPTQLFDTEGVSFISLAMQLMVVLVATYVFMYTAILFLTRAVTIIFLLILSPIGFVGGLLPKLEEYSKKWWAELVDAATFPVIYLLLLYISFQLINSMDGANVWAGFTASNGANVIAGVDISKTFKFIIIISALLISLKVAKDSAGQLGKSASGIAGGLSKFSTSIGGGSAALVGQYTVGAGAARLANSKALNQAIAGGGVLGAVASSAKGQLGTAADFHFDPRTTISEFGVKGGKGYASRMKEQQKAQEEAAKELAPSKEQFGTAKVHLEKIDHDTYGANKKYGASYKEANDRIKAAKTILDSGADPAAKSAAQENLNKAKSDLENWKTIIGDDDKDIGKTIANARIDKLKTLKDDPKAKREEVDAMEAVLRQEKAARTAAGGLGMTIAKAVSQQTKPADSTFTKTARVVGKAVNIGTLGLAGAAGAQYVTDINKAVKKIRDVMKEDDDKKQQDKIAKMLAKMAGTDAPGGGAGGGTKPPTGASGGGTTSGGTPTGGGKTPPPGKGPIIDV